MNNNTVYANLNERFSVDLGRLVTKPEMQKKTREDGTEYKFAKIRVATEDGYSTNQGYQEHSSYFLMFIFDPQLAETVLNFGRKGRLITIEGNCHQTINQNNNKWFKLYEVTALEFLDTKDAGSDDNDNTEANDTKSANNQEKQTDWNASANSKDAQTAPENHEEHLSTMDKVNASIKKIQEKANKISKEAHEKKQAEENAEKHDDEQTDLFENNEEESK